MLITKSLFQLWFIGTWQGKIPNKTVPSTKLSVNIPNLQPSVPYMVRIRANNSVGYGIPSKPVDIVMLEEAPSGPPKDIEVTALGSESLKITWMVSFEWIFSDFIKLYIYNFWVYIMYSGEWRFLTYCTYSQCRYVLPSIKVQLHIE